MKNSWNDFYEQSFEAGPRQTLLNALEFFNRENIHNKSAVDLGCGAGNDTSELIRQGWSVLAIDQERYSIKTVIGRLRKDEMERLHVLMSPLEVASWHRCSLVNASLSLPFCNPQSFFEIWTRIENSLLDGGRFAGHFFGLNDEWSGASKTLHFSRDEIQRLLQNYHIEILKEHEFDMTNEGVIKHWHIWDVVAKIRR